MTTFIAQKDTRDEDLGPSPLAIHEPTEGNCWAGDFLNRLVPALDAAGIEIVPGSVDESGITVEHAGRMMRWSFRPVAVTQLETDPILPLGDGTCGYSGTYAMDFRLGRQDRRSSLVGAERND